MAIDPKLVSIKAAGELPVSDPSDNANFLFYEGEALKRSPMANIYDKVSSGLLPATTSTVPSATGFDRYIVHTAGTYTNFLSGGSPIVVTAGDLDVVSGVANNRVILEVNNGVAKKIVERVKGDTGPSGKDTRLDASEDILDDFSSAATPVYFDGKFIQNNGSITNTAGYRYAEFIKRTKKFAVTVTITATPNFYAIHYFNSAGTWLGRDSLTSSPHILINAVFTPPEGTEFIRVNTNLANAVTLNFQNIVFAGLKHVDEKDANLQSQISSLTSFIFDQNEIATEYRDVFNALSDKPAIGDALKQGRMVSQLVDTGIWAKVNFFALLSTAKEATSLVNWKSPATKFTKVGSPVFTPYKGFKFSPGNYIDTNYNPKSNGIPDSFSFVVASSEAYTADNGFMAGVKGSNNLLLLQKPWAGNGFQEMFRNSTGSFINSRLDNLPNGFNGSKGYFGWLQNGTSSLQISHKAKPGITSTVTKTDIADGNLLIGGYKNGATLEIGTTSCSFVMIGKGLSLLEYYTLIDILEEYQRSVGNPLYTVATPINETKEKLNVQTFLTHPTSAYPNNSETIHPSVLYSKTKIFGYNWWMANTPYPAGDGNYEIPEIYVSEDGVNWVPSNPDNTPVFPYDGTHPYSDVCLRYDEVRREFVLFFRYTGQAGVPNQFAYITSQDGKNWNTSNIQTALAIVGIVPEVVFDGTQYRLYFQPPDPTYGSKFQYATSPTLKGAYSGLIDVVIPAPYTSVNHYGIIKYKGKYYMALARNNEMFIMVSNDGVTFNMHSEPGFINKTQSWENEKPVEQLYYKPCFVEENGNLWVYYSINADETVGGHYTGRQKILV